MDNIIQSSVNKIKQAASRYIDPKYYDPSSNGGNNFWSGNVAKGLSNFQQTNPLSIFSQAGQDYQRLASQNLKSAGEKIGGPTGAGISTLAGYGQRLNESVGKGINNVASGVDTTVGGIKKLPTNPLGGTYDIAKGVAKTAINTGSVMAQVNPIVAGTKVLASLPYADKLNVNVFGKDYNVPDAVANMAEFAKNPVWNGIFGKTSKLLDSKFLNPTTVKTFNYLLSTGAKGYTEGTIQGLADMPSGLSAKDQAKYLIEQGIFGAGSELLLTSVASKKLIKAMSEDAKSFIKSNSEMVPQWIPNPDGSGNFIRTMMPKWKTKFLTESGTLKIGMQARAINPDERAIVQAAQNKNPLGTPQTTVVKVKMSNIENPAGFDNPNNITQWDRQQIEFLKQHPEYLNKPILVSQYSPEDNMGKITHFIEDGQHRYQALKELGIENIDVEIRPKFRPTQPTQQSINTSSPPKNPLGGTDPLIQEARKYKSAKEWSNRLPVGGKEGRNMGRGLGYYAPKTEPIGSSGKMITVYRGVPKDGIKNIVDGDYVTLEKSTAAAYGNNVQTFQVPENQLFKAVGKNDYIFHSGETEKKLTDIWNKAQGITDGEIPPGFRRGSTTLFNFGKSAPELPTPNTKSPQAPPPTVPPVPSSPTSIPNPTDPSYNVNRMGVSNEVKQGVSDLVQSPEVKANIEKTVGDTLTFKDIQTKAQVSKELGRTFTRADAEKLGAEALALRNKAAELAKAGLTDEQTTEAIIRDKAFGSYVARLLGQRRIVSDPAQKSILNEIIGKMIKEGVDPETIIEASKKVDFNNAEQATNFYRSIINPKFSEWVDTLRYNSMLSGLGTHISNAAGNFGNTAIIAPIEKTLTGVVDFLGSKITGKERTAFAGEGIKYAQGYWGNVRNASAKFSDVVSGRAAKTNLDINHIPLATKGAKGALFKVLDFPMKLLEASDQFFSTLTEGGAKSQLAYRASKGVDVGNIDTAAAKDAAYRLYRQDLKPTGQGTLLNAVDEFTGKLMSLRGSDNPIVSTIAKFTVPFVKTPMNIFKQGVEYSPAGLLTTIGADNKTEQISKAILGSTVFTAAAMALTSGRTTWAEPTDAKKRNEFRAAGMQPYAIKIGDKWVAYSKLPPAIAFPFAMVSALKDAQDNKGLDDTTLDNVLNAVSKYGNFMADQSYVKSIGDLLSAVKGNAESMTRYVSNYPQQLVPFRALSGWVARLTDPNQRQVNADAGFIDKQVQSLMTQIPGLSQKVPARLDSEGKPVENKDRLLNAVSPIKITTENPEKAASYQEMRQKSIDTKRENTAREQVRVKKTPQEVGDKIFYFNQSANNGKGEVQSIMKDRPLTDIKPTGYLAVDQQNLKQRESDISAKINDVVKLTEIGKLDKTQAQDQINKLLNEQAAISAKRTGKLPTLRTFTDIESSKQSSAISSEISNTYKLARLGEITLDEANKRIAPLLVQQKQISSARKLKTKSRVKKVKVKKLNKIKALRVSKPKRLKKVKVL